ncbi:MAG: cytochrome c biogenesis protein CcsA, partial [Planctomycetota bacterium]
NEAYVKSIFSNESPDERVRMWTKIISAYSNGDARSFNREVASYLKDLERNPPEEYDPAKLRFESFYNRFNPFTTAYSIYFFAALLVVAGWVVMAFGNTDFGLQRTAFCLIILAFIVHTFALVARIYISGRPPVTNLYSSAVFIGWGAVVFGLVIEGLFKKGFGNVLSAIMGAGTLIIADKLAMSGDTFTVMQAVLDTQFWLATHVVCISLGYVATFVAGGTAIIYLLGGIVGRDREVGKTLARICYGTVCFAIIFSFIGTVLGGLWADDSWGRFWGWDPKENGALMIVLWNAVILHARWGGMVKDRGLAVLAVIGNIVTAWSWFGVNELGVGLHSYGFTEGVLVNLGWFVLSQLAVCLVGLLPLNFWSSSDTSSVKAVAEVAS